MRKLATIGLCVGVLTLTATVVQAGEPAASQPTADLTDSTRSGSDWVVKESDSICGVSTARQITNPAKVDYDELLEATSEMKELKREKIDKTSARGQALVTKATQKVQKAAKAVMTEKGHCSVWKKISHKQGTAVVDLTEAIKPKLD